MHKDVLWVEGMLHSEWSKDGWQKRADVQSRLLPTTLRVSPPFYYHPLFERKNMNLHHVFCSADAAMGPVYKSQLPILADSPTCNTAYNAFSCIVVAAGADAAPCDDSGEHLKPCYDLCIAYALACKATGGIATLPSAPKNLRLFPHWLPEAPLGLAMLIALQS